MPLELCCFLLEAATAKLTQDDRIELNTQSSTQWDGFRHWALPDGRHYNGVTQEEIESGTSVANGIHGEHHNTRLSYSWSVANAQ
jgi:hypothetical protein